MSDVVPGFKKGYDANRYRGGQSKVIIAHGMTMAELCQAWTSDSINLLGQIVTNTDDAGNPRDKPYSSSSRIKAAIALLDRGHGKPESVIKLSDASLGNAKAIQSMPTQRLLQLIQSSTDNIEQ